MCATASSTSLSPSDDELRYEANSTPKVPLCSSSATVVKRHGSGNGPFNPQDR